MSNDLTAFAKTWDESLGAKLRSVAVSGALRDSTDDSAFLISFCDLLIQVIQGRTPDDPVKKDARTIVWQVFAYPEWKDFCNLCNDYLSALLSPLIPCLIRQVITSKDVYYRNVLYWLYRDIRVIRLSIRKEISSALENYAFIPAKTLSISPLLEVAGKIVGGLDKIEKLNFLDECLLPLHRPNGWSLWDRQEPLLAEYHKSLVFCMQPFVKSGGSTRALEYILACFPPPHQANTSKDLLLWQEIDGIISEGFVNMSSISDPLFTRIVAALQVRN